MPTTKTERRRQRALVTVLNDGFGFDMIDSHAVVMAIWPGLDPKVMDVPDANVGDVMDKAWELKRLI